jgi:uncharacterized protein involved in outer membrane biogenesis
MRALRWLIISVAVMGLLAVLAIAVGAVWLNTFIHSESFRHEIEARAGKSLGGTVQIQTVDFNIFEGVKLQGLVTQIDPAHVGGQGALLMKVENVNCTYAWKELFHRTLKLTGVTLDKPQIVLTKQPTAPATSSPGESVTGTTAATGAQSGPGGFQFVLDGAKINDGALSMRDESGATVIDLQGINAHANTAPYYEGKDVTGTLSIADVVFSSNWRLTNFSTPFLYGEGAVQLQAKPFAATTFGGNVAGGYELKLNLGPDPANPQKNATTSSILDFNGKGLDLAQATSALNPGSSRKLSGSLDLQSKWRDIESGRVNGEGDAQVTNGKLEGVKILQDLSGILRVKELNAPDISRAQTHFLVENRQTRFTGLQVESTVFKLTGDGVVGFDGGLDANLVLVLSRDAMGKMPKEVAASFVQQQDGSGSIAFHVTGTTSNPQTDLAARLLIQNTQIQNIITKQLDKFFKKKSQNPDPEMPLPQNPAPAQ